MLQTIALPEAGRDDNQAAILGALARLPVVAEGAPSVEELERDLQSRPDDLDRQFHLVGDNHPSVTHNRAELLEMLSHRRQGSRR